MPQLTWPGYLHTETLCAIFLDPVSIYYLQVVTIQGVFVYTTVKIYFIPL